MEEKLERLVKEKEQSTPMEVIPLCVVPLAGVSTATVAATSTTESLSDAPLSTLEKTIEISKSMEEMNLQETKISRLKMEVEILEELKSSYQTSFQIEKKTTKKLKQELQQMQKQTVAGKTLVEDKEKIWMDISDSIKDILPMVQIIFEQNELVLGRRHAIDKIKRELGTCPLKQTKPFDFLIQRPEKS